MVFISTEDPIRNQKKRFVSLKINFTTSNFFSLLKLLSIPFDFLGDSDYPIVCVDVNLPYFFVFILVTLDFLYLSVIERMGYACELNGLDEANINDISIIRSF